MLAHCSDTETDDSEFKKVVYLNRFIHLNSFAFLQICQVSESVFRERLAKKFKPKNLKNYKPKTERLGLLTDIEIKSNEAQDQADYTETGTTESSKNTQNAENETTKSTSTKTKDENDQETDEMKLMAQGPSKEQVIKDILSNNISFELCMDETTIQFIMENILSQVDRRNPDKKIIEQHQEQGGSYSFFSNTFCLCTLILTRKEFYSLFCKKK